MQDKTVTGGPIGLFNHRYFYKRLEQEIARARRYGMPVSPLMIDRDELKAFNDRHGAEDVAERIRRMVGATHFTGSDGRRRTPRGATPSAPARTGSRATAEGRPGAFCPAGPHGHFPPRRRRSGGRRPLGATRRRRYWTAMIRFLL